MQSIDRLFFIEFCGHSSRVLPLEKFFSFVKLLRITSLVLKFGSMLWQLDVDSKRQAAIFLMKTMQQQVYPEELEFLLDPSGRTVPKLLWDLDLVIDRDGVIRSWGRIVKLNTLSNWLNIT